MKYGQSQRILKSAHGAWNYLQRLQAGSSPMPVPLYRWLVDCDGKVADEVRDDEASDRVRGLIRDHHRLEAQHVACAAQRVFSARA